MEIHEYGDKDAKIVLIQMVSAYDLDMIEAEITEIKKSCDKGLTAFTVDDWNKELSPWEAPAVFGDEGFGEGAEETLKEVLAYCTDSSKDYYIGGYSLAGLFALWAVHKTDVFRGVAAVSPSMWFPGFDEFMDNIGRA